MSCSKLSRQDKVLLISWLVIAVVFFILGTIFGSVCLRPKTETETEVTETEVTEVTETNAKTMVDLVPLPEAEPTPEYKFTSLGVYKLTAYCSCEKCCGHWATIRPTDAEGNPIVYTASQDVAEQGVTVAADTSVLPFGTVLLIDDHEYTVQDRGGAINGKRIDIYFDSHEEALRFGVQYQEIFIKEINQ